ncbi:MAG: RNA recognition motif domain-containing protein [Mucilaginibacter sp.]
MAKLFIVGFPREMSAIKLLEMFSLHGIVKTMTNITDKETGMPKGYAFVTMRDNAGALRAIDALNGVNINGRTLSVRFAHGHDLASLQ